MGDRCAPTPAARVETVLVMVRPCTLRQAQAHRAIRGANLIRPVGFLAEAQELELRDAIAVAFDLAWRD